MRNINDGITFKKWHKVIEKIEQFNSDGLAQLNTKDKALAYAVREIRKVFKEYKIEMAFFHSRFYVYTDDYWNEIKDDLIEIFLRDCCKKIYAEKINFQTSAFYKALRDTFRDDLRIIPETDDDRVLLNCMNGTLEFNKKGFFQREHNIEDYLTYKLNYDYDENATCPRWDSFLDEMLPDKTHQLLLHQYVGYTFTNHLKLEKALFLYGDGGNGKSVVQEVITSLLGKENTSSVSLGKLTKDLNTIMLIEGKLLNYCSENERFFDITNFKALVSGEPVLGKKLYQDVRNVSNYAKLMFNLNSLPEIKGESISFLRRLLILEFNNKPKKVDPELHHKIIREDLAGIFNRVLEALNKLNEDKRFVYYRELDETLSSYNYDNDIVQQFIDEVHETGFPNGPTKVSEIHTVYVAFCNRHQEERLTLASFAKELINKGYEKIVKKDGTYYNLQVVVGGSSFDETFENLEF
jgi:putative DNA primase/helicase